MILELRSRKLDLRVPRVMGVLNCTPDSFFDGGRYRSVDKALSRVAQMVHEGAELIDIGGESSRPGAQSVEVSVELDRVLPIIEAVTSRFNVITSIDTTKPAVMREALKAGVELINDINALRAPGAVDIVRDSGAAVCLMHMQGEPRSMQQAPTYTNVVSEVVDFLTERTQVAIMAGVPREKLCIDPGFGFGKTEEHNYLLLAALERIANLGLPVAVGFSRKSMLGGPTGRRPEDRLAAGIAAAVLALRSGASIVRTHDIAPTVDALKIVQRVNQREY